MVDNVLILQLVLNMKDNSAKPTHVLLIGKSKTRNHFCCYCFFFLCFDIVCGDRSKALLWLKINGRSSLRRLQDKSCEKITLNLSSSLQHYEAIIILNPDLGEDA